MESNGTTSLYQAVEANDAALFFQLLEEEKWSERELCDAAKIAIGYQRDAFLQPLIDDLSPAAHTVLLFFAFQVSNRHAMQLLIGSGADHSCKDSRGLTPPQYGSQEVREWFDQQFVERDSEVTACCSLQ